jgi:rRNA-processing protein EBP2
MGTKSKLKMALAAEKGTDFNKLKLHKKEKLANKKNRMKAAKELVAGKKTEDEWEDVEENADAEEVDGEESGSEGEEEDQGLMKVIILAVVYRFLVNKPADKLRRN